MSDVERIVNANHERVRWAEEYEGGRIATASTKPRNDRMGTDCHGPDGPRNDSGERIATASSKPRNDRFFGSASHIRRLDTPQSGLRPDSSPIVGERGCQRGGQGSGRPTEGELRKAYRSTSICCAMFTGGASAFVGIGLSMGRWLTVAVGLLVAVLFLACGAWAERLAEGADA